MKFPNRCGEALALWWGLATLLGAAQTGTQSGSNTSASTAAAARVLILSGGGPHDWRKAAAFLGQLLTDSGHFDVRTCEAPAGLTSETLAPFDVVVDDSFGAGLDAQTERALENWVNSGRGLVVTRGGLAALADPAAAATPAGRRWSGLLQATVAAPRAAGAEGPCRLFEIKNVLSQHPVMAGWKAGLRTADQPLVGLTLQPGAKLLAATDQDAPLVFVSSSGAGRILCTGLGTDLGSMQEKAFITTFLRGTEWAASSRVTLPAELGLPGPATNGVRLLIITGGHDHESSFYGLFDGYKDIGWAPVADSKLAFQQDIRSKYDVLVFYDFTRDLDEKGKQNLRAFVESGKGVVVLHHGILNFQKWPWWYEEVVGGLYRLERQGDIPNSTVKFGEEHWLTAATNHPITAGITPFHVTDETYHGLYISPKITPLLLTDNPTSDRTVAWIGPSPTSRVVFIQLGHDHSPFRHPSYRALVHNSILWTAGKLK